MAKTYCPECDAVISVNDPREGTTIKCPDCDSAISMNKPREGAVIICPHCGVELEVIRTDPFASSLWMCLAAGPCS